MASEQKIPPIGFTREQPGISSANISAIFSLKRVIKLSDLSVSSPGTEVTFPQSSEVAIFADVPVDVQIGASGRVLPAVTDLYLTGVIDKVFLRKRNVAAVGAISIFHGQPELGRRFEREDILTKASSVGELLAGSWAAATTAFSSAAVTIPNVFANEALYIENIIANRSAGTISTLEYEESDTGFGISLLFHEQTASGLFVYTPPTPIKIANSGIFKLTGSNEAGITVLDLRFTAKNV